MKKYQRKKLNKILLISAIILAILTIIIGTISYINLKKEQEILYEDTVICNNYFNQIIVDFNKKQVKRDDIQTTLQEEFNITEEQENLLLSSFQELQNFFSNTVFEIEKKENIAYITNKYQTKKLLVEVETLNGEFKEAKVSNLQDNLYLLEYDTQKRTKSAFESLSSVDWIKKVENDEVLAIQTINDESQTVYGEKDKENKTKYNTYGIEAMGLANYKNIIKENGNPSEVVVATIGYGVCIENQYFKGRINENYYNFMEESKNIPETVPQGSRIAEVIKDATADNVKIMPLVVVNSEGYTTTSTIIRSIEHAIQYSDVICYELVNDENYMITLALEKAFKENKAFCCVTIAQQNNKKVYPANNATTIAVSSIDKKGKITTYSGSGDYIDFSAYSTDIEEIFNKNSTISKWSGAQYSNAHIVSAIALIKSYHKDYTILEVYNVLRNYCVDLGKQGKDEEYGYGCPNFSKITIKDIDKQNPEIQEVKYDNENWEKTKKIQIIASDNIRILAWAVTTSENKPTEWNKLENVTPTLDIIHEIKENNKYYIWVKDSAENISKTEIEINRIDTIGPEISYQIDNSTLESEKYVTIAITAKDDNSGLHDMPYSLDGQNWGTENNILKVTENGRYKIYVRDKLENVSEKEILVDAFPRGGIASIDDGEIIKSIVISSDWDGDTNNSVRITFNGGLNLEGWRITTSNETPSYFETIEEENTEYEENDEDIILDNEYEFSEEENEEENLVSDEEEIEQEEGYNFIFTITKPLKAETTYYVWIKDINNNIMYQTFKISKAEI